MTDSKLNAASIVALPGIFLGWFFIDTLVVSLGSLQHGVRFFDLPSVIADPTRLFFGIERTLRTALFAALCLLCLLLPLTAYLRAPRTARLGQWAPLGLMLICGIALYSRTAGEFFPTPSDSASVGGNLVRLANGLVHRGGGAVARHVSVGAGGYLAFLASVVLAAGGMRRHRRQASDAT